ncbi:MAG: hypothetical protein F4X48_05485 [Acidimicrobiia bacterium]|nr:hypothetical protein [Acidimicrobiia bacterium]MYI31038.1 hypothetical protein [Acidimicrobiia bacterium]
MSAIDNTINQTIKIEKKLTDNLICSEHNIQDHSNRNVSTFETRAFETIDNDRESWLLGVLPPS